LKESKFQLTGKPKLNGFSLITNKEYKFSEELALEIDNNISIIKGTEEHARQAIVVLKIGIFSLQELSKVPFQINVEIEGYFNWDDELEKNAVLLDAMLKQNAPAILFSYVRPLITLLTVEADMPPLVIPLMNFKE
jgi:preprotein translocase subunit SecB